MSYHLSAPKVSGWLGPRDPAEPNLNIGQPDGSIINCTFHDMGDCPYHDSPEEAPVADTELARAQRRAEVIEKINAKRRTRAALVRALARHFDTEELGRLFDDLYRANDAESTVEQRELASALGEAWADSRNAEAAAQ
jgi:hypothetical protein